MKSFITEIFKIIFVIILLFGGFIFPVLYFFDIGWLNIICIIYAIFYALASIFGGNFIPYAIIYIINLLVLMIRGNDNILLMAFIEVPFVVNIYNLLATCSKKNMEDK